MDRAKKGERGALALCVERLIRRLKDAEELPEDSPLTTNQHTEKVDLSQLTNEELDVVFSTALDKAPRHRTRIQPFVASPAHSRFLFDGNHHLE